MHNVTSLAAGEPKRPMSRTLAPLSPTHSLRCVLGWGVGGGVGSQWLQMTGALRIKLPKFGEVKKKVISSQCALDVSIISGKPEVHPIISLR